MTATPQKAEVIVRGTKTFVRRGKSGRALTVKGYGALEGEIAFRSDVDLTKPIWEQTEASRSVDESR